MYEQPGLVPLEYVLLRDTYLFFDFVLFEDARPLASESVIGQVDWCKWGDREGLRQT